MMRKLLTGVVAIGLALGVAAAPAGARRDQGYEATHHEPSMATPGESGPGAAPGYSETTPGYSETKPGDTSSERKSDHKGSDTAGMSRGVASFCRYVFAARPGGPVFADTGELVKDTDPSDGATVLPGDTIDVVLSWDPDGFNVPEIHGVVDCVYLDGDLLPELSVAKKSIANDGSFRHHYTVPSDAKPGSELCDQGMIAGNRSKQSDLARAKSNRVCFTIGAPAPPAAAAPGPPEIFPPIVPAPPPQVLPAVEARPPAAAPARLPRTGTNRVLLLLAGVALLLGGLALVGGAQARSVPNLRRH